MSCPKIGLHKLSVKWIYPKSWFAGLITVSCATNKSGETVVKMIQALLFNQKEKLQQQNHKKKLNEKFIEIDGEVKVGDKVKMRQNRSIGIVKEIRGKKIIVQVGIMPITVALEDLAIVIDKELKN